MKEMLDIGDAVILRGWDETEFTVVTSKRGGLYRLADTKGFYPRQDLEMTKKSFDYPSHECSCGASNWTVMKSCPFCYIDMEIT